MTTAYLLILFACTPGPAQVRQQLEAGRISVHAGDCPAATPHLEQVVQHGAHIVPEGETTSLANLAGTLLGVCRDLRTLDEQRAADPVAALETLLRIAPTLQDTAYSGQLHEHLTLLWQEVPAAALASPSLCQRWEQVLHWHRRRHTTRGPILGSRARSAPPCAARAITKR